jgi:bacterioferritin (cytochrome b1)
MLAVPELPIPIDAVPERVRRFADPNGPAPARMMAARGMVPVKGGDLVLLLVQLTTDTDSGVSQAASDTLAGLPEGVLLPACTEDLPPAVFHEVAARFPRNDEVLARLAANHAVADATIAKISAYCPERITEIIAINQQRLISAPQIIEALYKNRNTRMSTADRLIELAARHDLELPGIPMYEELKREVLGQLIPEASEEPLPSDEAFAKALEQDADQDAVERDTIEGTEETKKEFVPLQNQIRDMNIGEKIRMALLGNAAARSILVRDPNRVVAMAAISSPTMSENEAKNAAQSREVSEDVLRYIGRKREWLRSYEIKRYLCNNPKTPLALSMTFLAHLRRNDLRALSRSRGIPSPLKQAAKRRAKQYQQ